MSTYAFIACNANGTIEVHKLDPESGTLRRLSIVEGVDGVNTLAFDHGRAILYAGRKGTPNKVSAYTVVAGGRLELRGETELPHSLAYLAFDGDALLVASYHDNAISRVPLDEHGIPTADRPVFTDAHAGRQMHSVAPSKDGRHVYAASLGTDEIVAYRRGGEGEEQLVRLAPTAVEPAGSGPRHLQLSSDGTRLTVVTEMTGEVVVFARDAQTGALTRTGSASVIAPDAGLVTGVARVPGGAPVPERPIWAAEMRQARGGSLWLTTERTTSTLTVLAAGESPRVLSSVVSEERPRAAAVAPSGDLVLVGGEVSDHVSVYRVGEDGELEATQRIETGGTPAWFAFQRVD